MFFPPWSRRAAAPAVAPRALPRHIRTMTGYLVKPDPKDARLTRLVTGVDHDGNPVTVDFWNPALGACESLLIEDGRVIPIVVDRVTSGLMPRRLIDNVVRILIGTP